MKIFNIYKDSTKIKCNNKLNLIIGEFYKPMDSYDDKTFSTSQIAEIFDLHPNTIRLYESWGVISAPIRKKNGYRVFTKEHVLQLEIVRIALRAEVVQNGLRKQAIDIIQTMAKREYKRAILLTDRYLEMINIETNFAEEAIIITEKLLKNELLTDNHISSTRIQVSKSLNISIEALRNWERNGLIKIKRRENGYRIYDEHDLQMIKIIRVLKEAGYSLAAILRMITALYSGETIDVKNILNTPDSGEFIISVCDKLLHSLYNLKKDAELIKRKILEIK